MLRPAKGERSLILLPQRLMSRRLVRPAKAEISLILLPVRSSSSRLVRPAKAEISLMLLSPREKIAEEIADVARTGTKINII